MLITDQKVVKGLDMRSRSTTATPPSTGTGCSTGRPADRGARVVLLHGFPTSSFMFRNLIPRLADRYRVIAPDHLGFGLSDAPSVEEFDYTFDALTDLTEGLLGQLGVTRYAIYVQDYGAPIGWRLALRHPQAITAIVTQNGNGYDEGFVESFWTAVWDYQREQTPTPRPASATALDVEGNQVAVPDRRPRRDAGQPGHLEPRRRAGRPARQRRDPAQAVPRLRHQPAAVPGAARLPAHQQGAGAGGVGRRATRSSGPTAPARSARTRATPRSTCSTAATSCWRPRATRSRI